MAKKRKSNESNKGGCSCKDATYTALSWAVGLMFLTSGIPKLVALFSGQNPLGWANVALWLAWIVAVIESVGGLLFVLGMLRMYAGPLLIVVMIVAAILSFKGPFFWGGFAGIAKHLVYMAAVAAVMMYKGPCPMCKE